jgi:hypothetical protein
LARSSSSWDKQKQPLLVGAHLQLARSALRYFQAVLVLESGTIINGLVALAGDDAFPNGTADLRHLHPSNNVFSQNKSDHIPAEISAARNQANERTGWIAQNALDAALYDGFLHNRTS